MGTLIGKAYHILSGTADHTYVECGTGKVGWSCWGGKTGGDEIARGTGSTNQANAIAGANERGGITCYAINGVCHQAANRILWPTRVLVSAARGYWVSSSLYGTYGRENPNFFHVCEAPFDQHNGVTGDLPDCMEAMKLAADSAYLSTRHFELADRDISAEKAFAEAAMALHTKTRSLAAANNGEVQLSFQQEHFSLQSRYRLGSLYGKDLGQTLNNLITDVEKERSELERAYAGKDLTLNDFADRFNELTVKFQDYMAETLAPEQYRAYFSLERTERVKLLDPDILVKMQSAA